ncbi:YdeI/OmpD-associated family protein [Nakamurella sp.]|uniref:YdeI/OmpD-associated family protein n=1 Tax=Nakamurella sp. TaxID=1869182 RepID=UPI003B3BBFA6
MITDKGVAVPEDMAQALAADQGALEAFQALRPDDQRVYVKWIGAGDGADGRRARLDGLGEHVKAYQRRPAEEHGSPHPLQDL